MAANRPSLDAQLSSQTLDLDELNGLLKPERQSDNAQATSLDTRSASRPIFDPALLETLDATVQFRGKTLVVSGQELKEVAIDATLQAGHLSLKPKLLVAGGEVRFALEMMGQKLPVQSSLDLDLRHVEIERALAIFTQEPTVTGTLDGDIELETTGVALEQLLKSATGLVAFTLRTPEQDTEATLIVTAPKASDQTATDALTLEGKGRVRGEPLQLRGKIGSLHQWEQGQGPFPVQANFQIATAKARLHGHLEQPRQLTGLDVQVTVDLQEPAKLSTLLRADLPPIPATHLEGRLQHADDTAWTFKAFKARVGQSDLGGELALATSGERLSFQADLQSQQIHIDEMTEALTSADAAASETSPKDSAADTPTKDENQPLLPDVSIDPEWLNVIDADVRFQGDTVVAKGLPLDGVSVDINLQDGHLKANSKLGVMGGAIKTIVDANSRKMPMQNAFTADIKRVDIRKIFTELGMEQEAFGEFNGEIELAGTGHTLADVLKSSEGRIVLTMAGGQLDSVITEVVGLDIGEALIAAFADKNEVVPIRCLVMNLNATRGKIQIERLIVDTTDTKIVGRGFVDFGAEQIDLEIEPRAKDFSMFSAESTLHVEGPFADISAGPKLGELLLSLAVPIKPGHAKDANCDELIESAEQFYQQSKP